MTMKESAVVVPGSGLLLSLCNVLLVVVDTVSLFPSLARRHRKTQE